MSFLQQQLHHLQQDQQQQLQLQQQVQSAIFV